MPILMLGYFSPPGHKIRHIHCDMHLSRNAKCMMQLFHPISKGFHPLLEDYEGRANPI